MELSNMWFSVLVPFLLASCFLDTFLWGYIYGLPCFIAGLYSIKWINQNLFISAQTDGHLGCFEVLLIINKAVVNI